MVRMRGKCISKLLDSADITDESHFFFFFFFLKLLFSLVTCKLAFGQFSLRTSQPAIRISV